MPKKTDPRNKSVDELISFFDTMFSQRQPTHRDTLSIPGDNAYVPSYISGGANQERPDGQLESDSKRDRNQ